MALTDYKANTEKKREKEKIVKQLKEHKAQKKKVAIVNSPCQSFKEIAA